MLGLQRPNETLQRLARIVDAADARRLRVTALKVSALEHAELCRVAMVAKGSFIAYQHIPLQVVRA
jgi:hypothetical protein